jgi:hypothetical protein
MAWKEFPHSLGSNRTTVKIALMTQAVWKRLSSPQKLQRMGVVHVDVTV